MKPLIFVSVDGGPDEAPKNEQSFASWRKVFLKYNLDALFVFTHAPGSSAYNPAERKMAPLSKDTAGLVLPFDIFGTHLNASNEVRMFYGTFPRFPSENSLKGSYVYFNQ